MLHELVKSSVVVSVGHDEITKRMEVTFTSGKTYTYENVERGDFEALRDAPSVGKHFNEFWRDR